LEDEIPSRLKTKPVKHPPINIDFAKASETYRDESDLLGEFITDGCVMQGKVERRILLAEYKAWCNDVNEKPVSSKRFASLLRDRGVSERKEQGNRIWVGISLAGQGKIS
jgi:phage/plasmid-associated DNA primase